MQQISAAIAIAITAYCYTCSNARKIVWQAIFFLAKPMNDKFFGT